MRKKRLKAGKNDSVSAAIIEPVGGHGGMDYYDFGLCGGLLAAGCRTSLYTCNETRDPHLSGLGFFPVFRNVFGNENRWKRAARYFAGGISTTMRAVLRGEKICHYHFFQGAPEEVALAFMGKLFARKIVITVHDVESFLPGAIERSKVAKVYRMADRLVVHNRISEQELIRKFDVPPESVAVIPHGQYIEEAQTANDDNMAAKRALGISETSRVLLFFGHIREVKGLDLLLDAAPIVAKKIPEVTILVGGRPLRKDFSDYEQQIDRLGIRDRCILHIRHILNEELPLFYKAADLVILPYRRIYQSGVILMAMSYNRPVVVSDLPAMTDMVTHGENGYVFTSGSPKSLAEQLIFALNDDEGRARVAQHALDYVRENNSWEIIGEKTLALYRSIHSVRNCDQ
jgi:D-inositol-3-phosphate glycosyltransferase